MEEKSEFMQKKFTKSEKATLRKATWILLGYAIYVAVFTLVYVRLIESIDYIPGYKLDKVTGYSVIAWFMNSFILIFAFRYIFKKEEIDEDSDVLDLVGIVAGGILVLVYSWSLIGLEIVKTNICPTILLSFCLMFLFEIGVILPLRKYKRNKLKKHK